MDLDAISRDVRAYNAKMVDDLKKTWQGIFHKMFHGLKPATQEKRDQIGDYDAAVRAKYGAQPRRDCVDDNHGQPPTDWLA